MAVAKPMAPIAIIVFRGNFFGGLNKLFLVS
jgi:hypothetical protein